MSLTALPADESTRLSECEQTIAQSLKNFVDVGTALLEIQQHRLYRSTHATFAAYCKERWGMSGRRGYQMIESAQIVGLLPFKSGEKPPIEVAESVNHGSQPDQSVNDRSHSEEKPKDIPAPKNENSIRPLSKVPKDKVAKTYKRAVEIAGGEAPTQADTEQAVAETRNELAQAMGYTTPEEANEAIDPNPSTAMMHAEKAVERLANIEKQDPEWAKAFALVRQFLNDIQTEWEAE